MGSPLKRGRLENAAEIIMEAVKSPRSAPTKIMARAGVQYAFLYCMLNAGLVEAVKTGKRRRRLMVTPKGREFIQHYKICDSLFPETYLSVLTESQMP